MNTNEYLNKVSSMLQLYSKIEQQPSNLDCTKHLYYAINDIRQCINNMAKEQVAEYLKQLAGSVENMKCAGIATDPRELAVYKTAIAYIQYYTTCRIDYYMSCDRQGQEFLFNNIYTASDWAELFGDETYSPEQQYYIKTLLLGLEAEALRNRAMEISGANKLVLYGFNENVICEKLVTPTYAQIAICGPITKNQNESFNYYKYNLKNKDGNRYGINLGELYDSYAYALLADNCTAANKLYNYMLSAFKQIQGREQFRGCFYTFSGPELQKFAEMGINRCKHQLQEVKGCQFINNQQAKDIIIFGGE